MSTAVDKAPTKTVDGESFPAAAFAYVPDPDKPSSWKLRLFDTPADVGAGRPSITLTAAAAMALSPTGFRGNRVDLPAGARSGVVTRVAAAWLKARRQDGRKVSQGDLPGVLKGGDPSADPGDPSGLPVALEITLDEAGEAAFERLAKGLPVLGSGLADLGHTLQGLAEALLLEKADLEPMPLRVEQAIADLETLGAQIEDADTRDQLQEVVVKLRELAVPQAPPAEAKRERVGVFLRVPNGLARQFPAKEEDDSPPHATLLQCGELDAEGYAKVVEAIAAVAKDVQPFTVELFDYGEFSNGKGQTIAHLIPRTTGDLTLEGFHKALRAGVQEVCTPQVHPGAFKPHVTLAYLPEGETFKGARPSGSFTAQTIEVWGEHGGEFGRTVIQLGTGEVLRRVDSDKRGADVRDVDLTKRAVQVTLLRKSEDEGQRTVFGIVLEPETIDSQGDIYNAEEIEKTAWRFMERYQQFGLMHEEIVRSILPLESYCAPVDFEINGQKVKRGTWLLRVRVLDDEIWRKVRSGELTGFSIGGSAVRTPETIQLTTAA